MKKKGEKEIERDQDVIQSVGGCLLQDYKRPLITHLNKESNEGY